MPLITQCPFCEPNTGGAHEIGCPNYRMLNVTYGTVPIPSRGEASIECNNCEEWEPNIGQINSVLTMAQIYGHIVVLTVMRFCPYCGKPLVPVPD